MQLLGGGGGGGFTVKLWGEVAWGGAQKFKER